MGGGKNGLALKALLKIKSGLKKILILSYYFPPCNLTASERVQAYALYLNEFGYYPVIVTRNWDIPIKHARDEHKKTGHEILVEKRDNYEVHYLPFKPNLKSKLFAKLTGTRWYFLYLMIAFIYNVGENFSSRFTPFLPLLNYCKKLLKADKDFSFLLISAGPFHLFKFGYLLNKEFSIKWIADYRDDWNTFELFDQKNIFKHFVQIISKRNEKKWVGSSSFFISVSDNYVNKISVLHNGLPGYTILNGYISDNYKSIRRTEANNNFTIVYMGSLFPSQRIYLFLNAFKKFIDRHLESNPKVIFVGLKEQQTPYESTKKLMKGYGVYVSYTSRVSKKQAIELQYNANLLLSCSYGNLKGIPGSKIYEYVALKKPVLVCPTDSDIIEDTLSKTGQGYFARDEIECYDLLVKLYSLYGRRICSADNLNEAAVKSFSRFENVKKLAQLIDQINHDEATSYY